MDLQEAARLYIWITEKNKTRTKPITPSPKAREADRLWNEGRHEEAAVLQRQAALEQCPHGMTTYALRLLRGDTSIPKNERLGLVYLRVAANFRSPHAAAVLSKVLLNSQSSRRGNAEYDEGVAMMKRAADLGQPGSILSYAIHTSRHYHRGYDMQVATKYFDIAVAKNIPGAVIQRTTALWMAATTPETLTELLPALIEASNARDPTAMYLYGHCLLTGEYTARNIARGIELIKMASYYDKSLWYGCSYAKILMDGVYVNRNVEAGIEILKTQSANGNQYAQYMLSKLLSNGVICVQNLQQSRSLLVAAAEGGLPEALYDCATTILSPTDEDTIFLLRHAAEANYLPAQSAYYNSLVQKGDASALKYIRKVAAYQEPIHPGFIGKILNNIDVRPICARAQQLLRSMEPKST